MRGARRLPAALLAALALALAVGAGCGGEDTPEGNAYVEQLDAAQRRYDTAVDRIEARVRREDSAVQDRETLESYARVTDRVAAAVADIEAPDDVADLHAALVADFETYAAEVRQATQALTSGDAERVLAADRRLRRATATRNAEINAAIAEINAKLGAD